MTDQFYLQETLLQGQEAKALLEHPAYKRVRDTLIDTFTKDWRNSPTHMVAERERLYYLLTALDAIHGILNANVAAGDQAFSVLTTTPTDLDEDFDG